MFFKKGNAVVDLVGEHLDAVTDCLVYYNDAIHQILDGCDKVQRSTLNQQLKNLESEADQLRHKIIWQMLDGGLLVDSRKSLMRIIEKADMVAGLAENIVAMIDQERMIIPKFMVEPIYKMNEITGKQYALLATSIKQVIYKYDLDELFQIIRNIETLESHVDDLEESLIQSVFDEDYDLAYKLHLKQVINEIASISDLIEDISDDIEIVMLTRKV